jgi:hypothetical protein
MGLMEWTGSKRGKIAGFCEHRIVKLGHLREIGDKTTF